jgi:hypothetical protein
VVVYLERGHALLQLPVLHGGRHLLHLRRYFWPLHGFLHGGHLLRDLHSRTADLEHRPSLLARLVTQQGEGSGHGARLHAFGRQHACGSFMAACMASCICAMSSGEGCAAAALAGMRAARRSAEGLLCCRYLHCSRLQSKLWACRLRVGMLLNATPPVAFSDGLQGSHWVAVALCY